MPGYGKDPRVTAWPSEAFSYGRMYPDRKYPASPAAGSGFSFTVPGSELWRLLSVRTVFTAGAAVANRVPKLSINDADGLEIIRMPANGTVTANGAALAQWVRIDGMNSTAGDGAFLTSLPRLFLEPGWQISVTATNIQAADTFTAIRMWYEIAPNGDFGYPTGATAVAAGPTP